jgi:hypothetical protein
MGRDARPRRKERNGTYLQCYVSDTKRMFYVLLPKVDFESREGYTYFGPFWSYFPGVGN